MSEQTTAWKPVTGDLYPFAKFKAPGDKVAGKLIAKRVGTDVEGRPQDLYDILTAEKDAEGKPKGITIGASNKDLKAKLAKVEIGKLVSIEFKGTKKIQGRPQPMKQYEILVAG